MGCINIYTHCVLKTKNYHAGIFDGLGEPNPRWADSILYSVLKAKGSVEGVVKMYRISQTLSIFKHPVSSHTSCYRMKVYVSPQHS